jgi:hypothetical protein
MDILWNIEFGDDDIFPSNCECNFFHYDRYLFYSFSSVNKRITTPRNQYGKTIFIYKIIPLTGKYKKYSTDFSNDENILLSNEWCYFIDNGLKLFIGKYLDIFDDGISVLENNSYNIEAKNTIPLYEYEIDNKIVKYNGKKLLSCINKLDGNELWKISLVGYLYTKIECKNGHIFFGTAGMGSVLYTIELETGIIKRNDNNVKAVHYSWYYDTIILSDKKGNIQKINPYTNEVIENYKIKGWKLSDYSPIKIYDNKIFTIVYEKNHKGKIVCIKI